METNATLWNRTPAWAVDEVLNGNKYQRRVGVAFPQQRHLQSVHTYGRHYDREQSPML
jgi:hypothetical protein